MSEVSGWTKTRNVKVCCSTTSRAIHKTSRKDERKWRVLILIKITRATYFQIRGPMRNAAWRFLQGRGGPYVQLVQEVAASGAVGDGPYMWRRSFHKGMPSKV